MRFLISFGMTTVLTEKTVVIPSPEGARNIIVLADSLYRPQEMCVFPQLLIKNSRLI